MSAVRISHLTFKYPHHAPVLKAVSVTFNPGTLTLLTGPSGSGKSTLLKLMARLVPLKHGTVYYDDHPLSRIPAERLSNFVAMMFQDPNRQFTMKTVKHELIFTLENRRVPASQIPVKVDQILRYNHLTNFKNRQLMTLSGGEKQRVALAIITALNSKVILLDEPFTNVDETSRQQIMRKLVYLKQRGKTIVIVDHDLRNYPPITDQLLVIHHHKLIHAKFSDFKDRFKRVNYQWQLPEPKTTNLYQFRNFSVGYDRPLLISKNFRFFAHHATLITGPNGSGKSTLFRAMLKLIKYHGLVTYAGDNVQKLKNRQYYRHVNLVFQEATDQFLEITVKQELKLTVKHAARHSVSRDELRKWLNVTGLDHHLDQVVYSLSGGQQRSLQIIEALVNGAPVLLMDEPFQSLDSRLISFFKALLKTAVTRNHRTLIVISHQITPVADFFDYHVEVAHQKMHYQRRLHP